MLEELLALGHPGAEYDAWLIKIMDGDQFGSGFVAINPNSKIPALVDRSGPKPIRVFESGANLLYLAEKFAPSCRAIPPARRMPVVAVLADGQRALSAAALATSTPTLRSSRIRYRPLCHGGEAPARCARPATGPNRYLAGPATPSPISPCSPGTADWRRAGIWRAEFRSVAGLTNVQRWTDAIGNRPAAQRGRKVNCAWGELADQLHERHDASDFETRTQDKIGDSKAS